VWKDDYRFFEEFLPSEAVPAGGFIASIPIGLVKWVQRLYGLEVLPFREVPDGLEDDGGYVWFLYLVDPNGSDFDVCCKGIAVPETIETSRECPGEWHKYPIARVPVPFAWVK
jgi:hypothetical protein